MNPIPIASWYQIHKLQRLCQAIKHEDPGMTPTFIYHTPQRCPPFDFVRLCEGNS